MTTVKEEIANLKKNYKKDDHIAVAIWTVEDVKTQAKRKVTKKQAGEILDIIHRKQDCTQGISWDTIDYYIDLYFNEKANT